MPAVFFADETDLALAVALEQLHGDTVYPGHPDLPEVPRETIDDVWLPVIGERKLVVITRRQADPLPTGRKATLG